MKNYSSGLRNTAAQSGWGSIAAKIRQKGMPMCLVRVEASGAFDPRIQGYPTLERAVPVHGLKLSPTVEEVQGGVFAAGTSLVLVAGASLPEPPRTTDYLLFGGHRWEIGTIKMVQAGCEVLLYKMQVTDAGVLADAGVQADAGMQADAGVLADAEEGCTPINAGVLA